MKNGCCSKCQAKAKKPKNVEEKPNEEDVKQEKKEKPKTDSKDSEKEKPKTDSKKEDSDKKEKEKKILTWQHTSTKKERSFDMNHGYGNNNQRGNGNNMMSHQNGFNPPFYPARSMMNHAGTNPERWWPVSPFPRGGYEAFTEPSAMCEPYIYGGAPFHPYQPMAQGAYMSPYPPYWQDRRDTNPMNRYTSYADNYTTYCFY